MKKMLFALMLGIFVISAMPSCTSSGSEAASKLASMELTKDNKDEFVKTYETAINDLTQAIKDKDEAKVKAIGNDLSKAMEKLDAAGDVLSESEKMSLGLSLLGVAAEAQKSGIKLE